MHGSWGSDYWMKSVWIGHQWSYRAFIRLFGRAWVQAVFSSAQGRTGSLLHHTDAGLLSAGINEAFSKTRLKACYSVRECVLSLHFLSTPLDRGGELPVIGSRVELHVRVRRDASGLESFQCLRRPSSQNRELHTEVLGLCPEDIHSFLPVLNALAKGSLDKSPKF